MPGHHYTNMVHGQRLGHWVRTHHTPAVASVNCQLFSWRCTFQSKNTSQYLSEVFILLKTYFYVLHEKKRYIPQ